MESTFIDKLIDWQGFEIFVSNIYKEDPNLIVEHDVTLKGKSGAKRQIDVLITQKNKLHTYQTIVECKYWNKKVNRGIIDILYASMEDLNASKGVVFTTAGYEDGAQKYASSKNIDIFIVRELQPQEWGLPGRIIHFYMHCIAGNFKNVSVQAKLIPIVEKYPKNLSLNIIVTKDNALDEQMNLYSKIDGRKGTNLINLLWKKQEELSHSICDNLSLINNGADGANIVIHSEVEINFEKYEFSQLRFPYGAVNIDKLNFQLITHVSQTVFHFDRGENLDIALIVENYIKKQAHIVSKEKGNDNFKVSEDVFNNLVEKEIIEKGDVLENNSILKVYLNPDVSISLKGNEQLAKTNRITIDLVNE